MNCAACPITVKKALTRIAGVNEVDVDLEKWRAVVTYDDARTSVAALTKATSEAGYPSTVKER
jgi:mercuric ion binding protein